MNHYPRHLGIMVEEYQNMSEKPPKAKTIFKE